MSYNFQDGLIEEKEFAEMIHIPKSRLVKWRKIYAIPHYRINRKIYYNKDEFWNWYENDF